MLITSLSTAFLAFAARPLQEPVVLPTPSHLRQRSTLTWAGPQPEESKHATCDCPDGSTHSLMPGTGRIAYGRRATPSGGALGAGGPSPSNGSSNGGTNLSAGGNAHTGSSLVASAQASSDLPLIVQLDQVGDARGATLHGTVNLGGQNEILDRFGALAPQGGWLRINLALYDANPVARAASQLSHAKSRGWNVLVTAMGCPEHLASDSTVSPPGSPLPDWGSSVPNDPLLWAEEVVRS
ncbi:MAG: hypothetical protein MK213_01825, partial [Planctomycetes bacterium]|nr:hypothetical protein [Planctomycetota bacterium]